MKMQKKMLLVFLSSAFVISCQKKQLEPSSETDKTLYALGAKIGASLRTMKLTPEEAAMVSQGFSDSVVTQVQNIEGVSYDDPERAKKIQSLLDEKTQATERLYEKLGKEFMDKFLVEGGQKTASGLAYKIEVEGTGPKAESEDLANMHFEMSLIDGKILQSTRQRGESSVMPVNRLLRGWAEGVQMIKTGGKIQLVIPPDLAYGKFGAPPEIPGGAYIKMNIELFEVTKTKNAK